MTYEKKYHTEDMCDKCGKKGGKSHLIKVPFLYLDLNDKSHLDVSELLRLPKGIGYRQYYICKMCKKDGI